MIVLVFVVSMIWVAIGLSLLRAWAFSYLWLWFVVPLGVTPISFLHAFGLALIASLFTTDRPKQETGPRPPLEVFQDVAVTIGGNIIGVLLVLLVGYLVSGAA